MHAESLDSELSDAHRDLSLLNQGVEHSPEVPLADNEKRFEEAASPMHAESLDSEL